MKGFNRLCLALTPQGLCRSEAWSLFNCPWRAATGLFIHFSLIYYRTLDILKDRTTVEACLLFSWVSDAEFFGVNPSLTPTILSLSHTLLSPGGWLIWAVFCGNPKQGFTYSLLETRQMNPREPTSSHVLTLTDQGMATMERKVFCVFSSARPTENIFLSASHWLTTPRTAFLGLLPHEAPTTDWSPSGKEPEPEKYPKLARFQVSQ